MCVVNLALLVMSIIAMSAAIFTGIGVFWFIFGVSIIFGYEATLLYSCNW